MISDKNYLLPALPSELPADILEKASLLPAKAAFLDGRLAPATRARLAALLEVTNTYYSNLIEGQYSAPADMQRAQAAPKRERKQLTDLAMQQLGVQTGFERLMRRWDKDIVWQTMFSPWLVQQAHKALFRYAPPEQLKLHNSERYLVPGKLRSEPDEQVEVGNHLAPDAQVVSPMLELLQQFMGSYSDPRTRLIATLAYHHRLAWVHPFMDGNGRLSRFLFHYALCQSGKLTNGLLLPISVAMKRNEAQYLTALQSFSMQARQQWDVRWIDGEQYDFRFKGKASLYQFWDATPMVEFSLQMAQQALDKDLREATDFLARFDRVYRTIDEQFDVRGSDLTTLVISSLQNDGRVLKSRRKQFQLTVQAVVFDAIEEVCAQVMHD